MKPTTRRSDLSYLIAVAAVGVALAAHWVVHPLVGDRQPFAFFYLAVIVSAWFGVGPGLFALALGFVDGEYFFVTPRVGFVPVESGDVVAAVAYLLVGSAIVVLTHLARDAERRAQGREESLRARDAEREAVMMSMNEGLYTVDTEGRVTFINAAAERLFGWGSGELLGRKMHDATHYQRPDGTPFPASECAGLRVLRNGTPLVDHEDVFIRRDGTFFPVVYGSSRIVSDGSVNGLAVVFRDVTLKRQEEAEREDLLGIAERARAEAEDRLRDVQSLVAVNRDLTPTLELSALLPRLCGIVREIVGADGATFVLREGDRVHYVCEDAVAPLWAGQRFPIERCISGWSILNHQTATVDDVYADGRIPAEAYRTTFVKSLVMVPMRRDQEFVGAMGAYWSVPRKASEREIALLEAVVGAASAAVANAQLFNDTRAARAAAEDAARSLEASNRAKDEFLAMLAHELRNPLAAVRNAVAAASLDDARRPRALEIAQRQADQLGRMIDDLLDVARITQGRIALRKELVRLADVVERAIESMRPFIQARGLALVVTHPCGPVRVEADPARLEQVFVNLLSNAAKYTDAGGRIDVVAERAGDGEVAVRIRDTGMGIAPEMMPRMWELFAQADREIDRRQGGLGIGLTVARRLVELHGARIDARSDGVGKGAEFVVTLDAQRIMGEEAAPAAADEPARRAGAHVLVVEDNRDTAESLTMLLDLYGHRVRTVYDGVAALDAAGAEAPDVMLVDIGLPGMDGYEVARRIRRDAHLSDVRLIALTGYGRDEDRRQALAAGFDHHLVKPVNPETLNGLVMSVVAEAPEGATGR